MRMTVTPVSMNPSRMAAWIGAAPRSLGRSEACTLTVPRDGRSMISLDRMCPYETTTDSSGSSARSSSRNAAARGFSGCSTGTPSAIAISLIGDGTSVERERPRGRSGCVTTAQTSNPSPTSARSDGAAKADVPQKRTRTLQLLVAVVVLRDFQRRDAARQRLVAGAQLLPLLERRAPLEQPEIVDEQLAVQVIDLVLEAARQQLGRVELDRFPLAVLRLDDDAHRALDVGVDVGNRQATLFAPLRSLAMHDLRIDDDVSRAIDVHDRDALRAPHLRRGEPDSLGGVHRLEHVVHELLKVRPDIGDGTRVLSEDRSAEHVDVEQAHDAAGSALGAMTRAIRPRSMTMRDSPV